MTVCVDASAGELEIQANWGRYERRASETEFKEDGSPKRAWKRIPAGGTIRMEMKPGWIRPRAVDPSCPEVCVQGMIREAVDSKYRMVSIFLVNDQIQPKENQDEAWVFQPELIVRGDGGEPIFQRRPAPGK